MTASGHLLAEVGLRVRLELLEDHRGDLGRRVVPSVGERHAEPVGRGVLLHGVRDERPRVLHLRVVPATTHEALDRVDGVGRVRDRLALRQLADEALAGLREGDDGRDGPTALGGRDDGRLAALHDRDDRVRRTEVDADDLAHCVQFSWCRGWGWSGSMVSSAAGFRR